MKTEPNKLIIPLGEYKIVASIYDMDTPEFPPEIGIHLCDKNDVIVQDIALVRPHYDMTEKAVIKDDLMDILVWGDPNDEDYTNEYTVGIYKYEEEE